MASRTNSGNSELTGVHVIWGAPMLSDRIGEFNNHFRRRNGEAHWTDVQVLCQLLSVNYWKRLNGKMVAFADSFGKRMLEKYGLDCFYDSVETGTLDAFNATIEIDAAAFWDAAKIYLCSILPTPYMIMDLDAYIRAPLTKSPVPLAEFDLWCHHWEHPQLCYVYGTPESVQRQFPQLDLRRWAKLSWCSLVHNTSFFVATHERARPLLRAYWNLLNDQHSKMAGPMEGWEFTFFGQRAISFLARDLGIRVGTLSPKIWQFSGQDPDHWRFRNQDFPGMNTPWLIPDERLSDRWIAQYRWGEKNLYHMWLDKRLALADRRKFIALCRRFAIELRTNFPELKHPVVDRWLGAVKSVTDKDAERAALP